MKKSELFEQAYRSETVRGYFCIDADGTVLWTNQTAAAALPRLEPGYPVTDLCPTLDLSVLDADNIIPLTGGFKARLTRFSEEDSDDIFYIAEFSPDAAPDTGSCAFGCSVVFSSRMREKISRIRSLISESRLGLCDLQADFLGTVPRLAERLDHQIDWISGTEKDCDGLFRHLLQFEENLALRADETRSGVTDLGQYLPLLFRDIELFLTEAGIPLQLKCDWNSVAAGCLIGCSQERISMALLGLVRVAAVAAAQHESGEFFVQGLFRNGSFLLRLRDSSTDPADMEAYEPVAFPGSEPIPTPAHFAANSLKRLMDTVGGSWVLGRTPGGPGYTMQLRFSVRDSGASLGNAVAYQLDGLSYGFDGRWPADLSGSRDLIRIMLSTLEDDMR